jgi:hypothetical protein
MSPNNALHSDGLELLGETDNFNGSVTFQPINSRSNNHV